MKLLKVFLLISSQFITLILNLSVQIILANVYSTKDTGVYFAIFALTNILSSIGLFGINKYYIYIKSRNNSISVEHAKVISQLFILINFICVISLLTWGLLRFPEYSFFIIGNTLILVLTSVIAVLTSIIQMNNKITIISIFQLLIPSIKVIGLFLGFYICSQFFKGYSIIVIFLSLGTLYILHINYIKKYKVNIRNLDGDYYNTFKTLIPYAFLNIFFTIYTQGNTFYIGVLETSEKAAYFAIAYLFVNTIFIFPTAIYQRILAHRLLRLIYKNIDLFKKNYIALQELIILLASVCMFFMYLFSENIIIALFGNKYFESIYILKLLLLIIPFRLITISIGTILSTNENIYKRIRAEILICIVNIGVNFTLIPILGINGAIISVIITEVLLAIFFTYIIEKKYEVQINRITYISILPIIILIVLNANNFHTLAIELLCLLVSYIPIKRRIIFLWKNL
ncbi:MATE family efflux transporter [Mammaliicoccus vitulinus]|uniref:polysaccharide biosynthesis C-terminal domain-containing protein n=1 Tax=Mammaliicoccus vitulinus TaxID=71237 RepID=UPI0002E96316|nr:polysaccharide biosynthesis C-terminal domain-containing protein [Mammaliicoccus vitulinus]